MSGLAPSLVDLYAPVRSDLIAAQRILDDELVSELAFVNALCDTVRSYRGKMLRPAILLLSAKAAGSLTPAHHTLAAVVEIVHLATLVHDDVLDEADERRRRPTVRKADGNVAAVLLGDYLISHAFHLCSRLDSQHASRRIADATNTVCEGELLQNRHRGNVGITEPQYLEIVSRKTGALTAVSCELGAYHAGAGEPDVEALRAYGMEIGIAFQIIDDVLDIMGYQEEVGKTLGLDVALGKLTLPTIHCLAEASPERADALHNLLTGRTRPDRQCIRRLLEETSSERYAAGVARRYASQAVGRLGSLPPSDARASLVGMAAFIVERDF